MDIEPAAGNTETVAFVLQRAPRARRWAGVLAIAATWGCTEPDLTIPAATETTGSKIPATADDGIGDATESETTGQSTQAGESTTSGSADSTQSDTDGSDSESSASDDTSDACPHEIHPGTVHIRRLTQRQYENTLRDLFPGLDFPALDIADAVAVHGLRNDALLQVPSAALIEAYHRHARTVTAILMDNPASWLSCGIDGGDDPERCANQALERWAPKILRRPPSGDVLAMYRDAMQATLAERGFAAAIELVISALLQSPEFLYHYEPEGDSSGQGPGTEALGGYTLANRLAYFLWDTMPDEWLYGLAAADGLHTIDQVRAVADTMLDDPRARQALVEFHAQWWDLAALDHARPDPDTYPDFDAELRASMHAEVERFIAHTVSDPEGRAQDLLMSSTAYLDPPMAALYGITDEVSPEDPVVLDPQRRAGLLTRAAFLTGHAQSVQPSPTRRGLFVLRRLLCGDVPDPPADLDTSLPGDDAGTNRDRYAKHTRDPACAGCHSAIDPIGFTFEHYDATGRWRELDNGHPVDSEAEIPWDGELREFADAIELSRAVAQRPEHLDCTVRSWTSYALGRLVTDDIGDPRHEPDAACILSPLRRSFRDSGGRLRALVLDIVTSDAFRHRRRTP